MSAEELRGQQVKVGKLSFHFPEEPPDTDEEIIEREEIVARIAAAIAPHEAVARLGKDLMKALQADITRTMKKRLLEDEEPSLFDYQEGAEHGLAPALVAEE